MRIKKKTYCVHYQIELIFAMIFVLCRTNHIKINTYLLYIEINWIICTYRLVKYENLNSNFCITRNSNVNERFLIITHIFLINQTDT